MSRYRYQISPDGYVVITDTQSPATLPMMVSRDLLLTILNDCLAERSQFGAEQFHDTIEKFSGALQFAEGQ